ncbi:MAG: 3-hydroxybutyryl-CoA dehydrogenase [Anaerocolumna sp.]|jgi:3-hydroxybutyryl-CoA dehydrogenase|nr:3-hydroxybutyryl-CoA dehydrogenase [Anaerocolumna sp.]
MNLIAVMGSGVMGHGIAQLYAQKGRKVRLYDVKEEALEHAKSMIDNSLSVMVTKEIMTEEQKQQTLQNLEFTTNLSEAVKDVEMVVEVVPEIIDLKRKVYEELETLVSEKTIIASNTSAIPLTELALYAKHPERFLITHFFAPAQLIPLVEIIQMEGITDPVLLNNVTEFLTEVGKSPIVLRKEVPGFIANRIQLAILREAFWLIENDVATAKDIDTVMKDSLGFRYVFLGPLEGQDIAGINTTYFVAQKLFPVLSDMKEPPVFLQEMIDKNEVGIRTKKGFYEYTEDSAEEAISKRNDNFLEVFKLRKKQQGK